MRSARQVGTSLARTAPTSRTSKARWMRARSRVKTPACRPYFESFTRRSASSKSSYALRVTTGAKTSCASTFIDGVVFARIVGWRHSPTRVPPRSTVAPPTTASATQASTRAASAGAIMGPTSVFSSSGSPTTSVEAAASSFSRNASRTGRWTSARWTEMQDWPAYENAPEAVRRAASSRSASEWTTTAAFPPSSRATRFFGTRDFRRHPTAPEPVNETTGRRGSKTSPSAAAPEIGRTTYASAGQPASRTISRSASADGDRRSHLVRREVEREIERRDGEDRAERDALHDAPAPERGRVHVERQHLALLGLERRRRRRKRRRRAFGFRPRRLQRLAPPRPAPPP